MGKKFKNRKKGTSGSNLGKINPWEKISGGFRGAAKYSRAWNSQYNGPGKGTN